MIYDRKNPLPEIRKRLEKLSNPKEYRFDDPSKYYDVYFPEFKALLTVISPPPKKENQFNCFAYALGLNKWIYTPTLSKAIENNNLIPTKKPKENDIVVYYEGSVIEHAGRYISPTKVQSKWAGGPIFEHDVFTCPAHYGSKIKYYKAVSLLEAQKIAQIYLIQN